YGIGDGHRATFLFDRTSTPAKRANCDTCICKPVLPHRLSVTVTGIHHSRLNDALPRPFIVHRKTLPLAARRIPTGIGIYIAGSISLLSTRSHTAPNTD